MALKALLDTEATAITCKVIEKALEGDIAALRLCIERLLPVRRERPMAFALPKIETAADALKASSALLAACAEGTLSPREATEIMALIGIHIRTLELSEIETKSPNWNSSYRKRRRSHDYSSAACPPRPSGAIHRHFAGQG